MAQKRLESVDLVLFGVQHTFDFSEEPVELDIELSGNELEDQIAAGREVLRHVESLEVQLVGGKPEHATVTIAYHVEYDGEVEVDLELNGEYDDEDAVRSGVEVGDFYSVNDAVTEDFERNFDFDSYGQIEVEFVSLFDEDGNDYEA